MEFVSAILMSNFGPCTDQIVDCGVSYVRDGPNTTTTIII